jgi:hypothetical protein
LEHPPKWSLLFWKNKNKNGEEVSGVLQNTTQENLTMVLQASVVLTTNFLALSIIAAHHRLIPSVCVNLRDTNRMRHV